MSRRSRPLLRLAGLAWVLLAALLGLVAGVLGSFLQLATVGAGGVDLPWGVVVGLGVTALAVTLAVTIAGAGGAIAAGGAWFLAVGVLSGKRPEGDLVITASSLGYVWLGLGALTVVAVVAVSALTRGAAARED